VPKKTLLCTSDGLGLARKETKRSGLHKSDFAVILYFIHGFFRFYGNLSRNGIKRANSSESKF
jgi:hypothetical protein